MFKIPDESINEDDIVPKTYFNSRNTVKLDETVRNHGRQKAPTTDNKEKQSEVAQTDHGNTGSTKPPVINDSNRIREPDKLINDSNRIGEPDKLINDSNRTREPVEPTQPEPAATTDSQSVMMATKSYPKSLADAFSFIKDTEFYDEEAVEKAAEENKKRKLERSPGSSKEVQPGKGGAEGDSRKHDQCSSGAAVLVSTRQKGNSLLPHLRNVVVSYRDDILPDYIVGVSSGVLFLSLKYHRLHPEYIYDRLRLLGSGFTVRVLLILVDIPDSAATLQELTKMALLSSLTLLLAWSPVEAARYIEAFKIYEHKPAEVLKGFKDTTYQGYLHQFLTSVRGVNKSDVNRLKAQFGSVKDVIHADKEQLSSIPGIGDKKAERMRSIFLEPFKSLDKT